MANPDGRPARGITKKDIAKIEECASLGMYDHQIAQILGYNPNWFIELKKIHPEITEALKRGQAIGVYEAAKSIMKEVRARNTVATIFYLKCKGGWRDNSTAPDDSGTAGNSNSAARRVLEDVRKLREKRDGGGSEGATDSEV